MLTLGWSDGNTFFPVNSILLSTGNKKNRINEAAAVDKRTVSYKQSELSLKKRIHAMLELLKQAKNADILQNMSFLAAGSLLQVHFMP